MLRQSGVEVLNVEERKGTRYFSIRDLRNGNVIRNVSPASARKLWSYAINQHLVNPVDPAKVSWSGEMGPLAGVEAGQEVAL